MGLKTLSKDCACEHSMFVFPKMQQKIYHKQRGTIYKHDPEMPTASLGYSQFVID